MRSPRAPNQRTSGSTSGAPLPQPLLRPPGRGAQAQGLPGGARAATDLAQTREWCRRRQRPEAAECRHRPAPRHPSIHMFIPQVFGLVCNLLPHRSTSISRRREGRRGRPENRPDTTLRLAPVPSQERGHVTWPAEAAELGGSCSAMGPRPQFWLVFLLHLLPQAAPRSFVVDRERGVFLLDGVPFRYVSGSLHYSRVPSQLWSDRLHKMRMSGLNAVQVYVPWNYHEPQPGVYNFQGNRDLVAFLKAASKEDLLVILRPGPYICAEWEMGGLPSWLLRKPDIVLRTSDPDFLAAVDSWFHVLLPMVHPWLYHNGGNIISVQVENEYGSYFACDFRYMRHLAGLFRALLGDEIFLFTTDGPQGLSCGTLQGLYSTVDFGPADNMTEIFAMQRKYEPSGPLVNSEYYTGWLDYWGGNHSTGDVKSVTSALQGMLELGANVNMYMFHGGTNFGYWNGADWKEVYLPVTTSYDYDAPLSEAGDPTPKLLAIQSVISKFQELPLGPLPPPSPKMKFGPVTLKLDGDLLNFLNALCPDGPIHTHLPLTFEAVNQDYGFLLYRTWLPQNLTKPTRLWVQNNGVHDRAYVMLDRVFQGTLARDEEDALFLTGQAGSTLDVLLENMGRVSFGANVSDFKGLIQPLVLGKGILTDWLLFPLNIDAAMDSETRVFETQECDLKSPSGPAFYSATFQLPGPAWDTFLYLPGWTKGQVWINGFNLGRYWTKQGPQQSLYVPGPLLLPTGTPNVIKLLELEHVPPRTQIWFLDRPLLNATVH
ncbi:beta-galactosidase-1-like protein isoform X2 [Dromiciops gliroides]|uniref:beta-galactosidase-1-like protein isoform X2 n=1 Tax=Dromiciops gliroides TaxID=33562 RepID=UPI001CC6F7CB|nr:beta-galactosidase-1-like protein isoform X2 [Dromiciops gliroides]